MLATRQYVTRARAPRPLPQAAASVQTKLRSASLPLASGGPDAQGRQLAPPPLQARAARLVCSASLPRDPPPVGGVRRAGRQGTDTQRKGTAPCPMLATLACIYRCLRACACVCARAESPVRIESAFRRPARP